MKEAGIKIGNSEIKMPLAEITEAIKGIFKSGYENRMEQETVRTALTIFGQMAKIDNVTVERCVIHGDKTVNMGEEENISLEDE